MEGADWAGCWARLQTEVTKTRRARVAQLRNKFRVI
jgi:hypothetical protein